MSEQMPELELIKWKLAELAAQDESDIESNEIEIYGEDDQGREGCCTVKITDIANDALAVIESLNKADTSISLERHEADKLALIEKVKELLKGIDMDEGEDETGWWETSTGAEYGKSKLNALINLIMDKVKK